MKEELTTDDYVNAIKRELRKRSTAYPKILAKMKKQNIEPEEYFDEMLKQNRQNRHLERVLFLLESTPPVRFWIHTDFVHESLFELMRELKMRKHYYPRLIYFKRLDEQTAAYELSVWESLTRWFAKEFLELDELPTKRKKKQ